MSENNSATFTLITGRSRVQAAVMESSGKFSKEYEKHVALVYMNPDDIRRLGLNGFAKIISDSGSVVLPVKSDNSVPKGVVFIPLGPWANLLISSYTSSIGMPSYKFVKVSVEAVRDEDLTRLEDIISSVDGLSVSIGRDLEIYYDKCREKIVNAVCTFCGLVCSDISVKLCNGNILETIDGCSISISKFVNRHRNRILKPVIRKFNSREFLEVEFSDAINKTVEILINSSYPLVYGLSNTSNEAIEIAVEIARILGGVIDSTTSVCHGPTILGLDGSSLKNFDIDVLDRIETVVVWGANPVEAHPKLINFVKKYVKTLIVIDVRETESMRIADIGLIVEPGEDLKLIRIIRAMIRGIKISNVFRNIDDDKIESVAEILMKSRSGVIFFGIGLTMNKTKYINTFELAKLVEDLNNYGEWYLQPLRGHFNVTGANIVMKNRTGYPFAVDFHNKLPFTAPGVTTAVDVIRNRDVDAVLVIASDPVASMPIDCVKILSKIPVVVIDSRWSLTASIAHVVIPVGLTGIECSGSVFRMDGKNVKINKIVDPPHHLPCDVDVLKTILIEIKKRFGYD